MILKKSVRLYLLGCLLLSFGCVPLAKTALSPGSLEELQGCLALFPPGPWESVHRIEATFRGGGSSTLLGVTRGEPAARRIQSLLLSPEGFTLFDGEFRAGEVTVHRAVPPFDSAAFAKGLMEDVTFIFLAPQSRPTNWGRATDGTRVCRWEGIDRYRTEVWESPDQGRRIRRWDDQGEVIREVSLKGPLIQGLAANIELRVFKPVFYKLKMTLLQSGS